jgi:OOP family OmpA-OmpF porin
MRAWSSLGAIAGAIAIAAAPAHGHPTPGQIDVGPFIGYHVFGVESLLGSDVGEGETTIDDGPLFGLRVGYTLLSRLGVELEGGLLLTNPRTRPEQDVMGFVYRANVLYRVTGDNLGGDLYLLAGAGGVTVGESDDGAIQSDTAFMPHLGLTATVEIGDHWGVRFDGRGMLTKDTSEDSKLNWEALFGVYYAFGRKPHAAAPVEPVPVAGDSDGDGIADDADKCPNEAETKNEIDDQDGCPEKDTDGDGRLDAADKCPNEPEDADGFQDEDGCPDPDNDGDGVADAADKCGAEPETKNGFQDDDGCPDEVPAAVAKFTGAIKGINFVTGSAKITAGSRPVLDRAVAVLKEHPTVRLEIAGHTDDRGSADRNRTLSQERAEAVKAYLVSKGIDESRLRAAGYGPDKPVDPAKTAAARSKNRRVEFVILTD